ncbi:hypothetical protein Tco_1451367 [Tanacetum coccineum]
MSPSKWARVVGSYVHLRSQFGASSEELELKLARNYVGFMKQNKQILEPEARYEVKESHDTAALKKEVSMNKGLTWDVP